MNIESIPKTVPGFFLAMDRAGYHAPEHECTPTNPGGLWRKRAGRGGGREYRIDVLPPAARTALALRMRRAQAAPATDARTVAKERLEAAELWRRYEAMPDSRKATAKERLDTLMAIDDLVATGLGRMAALRHVAEARGVPAQTIRGWAGLVARADRADWLAVLAPQHKGRTTEAACSPEAWDWLETVYLRNGRPSFSDCYRRLEEVAAKEGWTIPSERTLLRRVNALPESVRVLWRDGAKAMDKMFPSMRREKTALHAMEIVNSDGRKADVFVRWEDGEIARPTVVAWQDVYSGKILSWRVSRAETAAAVLLTFGDMVEEYGLPDEVLFDNGRAFASKQVTGGTPNRYRFKVKDTDISGALTILGVRIHWAKPGHGQSKPIERGWQNFRDAIDKHPRCEGAYTGGSPDAKPENYGSKAVPIDVYRALVAEEVVKINARAGRRSKVCGGRLSFDQAFAASYEHALVRQPRPEHARLWLLEAEGISTQSKDGSINLLGNRYWHEALQEHLGDRVVIRYDPDNLHGGLHVYELDGRYITFAQCLDDVGFLDAKEGRKWLKQMGSRKKAAKAAAERPTTLEEAIAKLPSAAPPTSIPKPAVVRPIFGNLAVRPDRRIEEDEVAREDFGRAVRMLRPVKGNAADE